LLAGTNTIADSSFAGVSNVQEVDFTGSGAQSVVLGSNAQVTFGSEVTVYTNSASSLLVNASAIGSTGVTAIDAGSGSDHFIAGTGGAYFTGGSGADIFEVGAGGTDYISDFVSGLDKVLLQGAAFSTLSQVLAVTTQYSNGIDIAIPSGGHVVMLGVQESLLHPTDFGLTS